MREFSNANNKTLNDSLHFGSNNCQITVKTVIYRDNAIINLKVIHKITLTIYKIAVLWWHKTERKGDKGWL